MNKRMIGFALAALLAVNTAPAYADASKAPLAAEGLLFIEPLADGAIRLVVDNQLLASTGESINERTFVSLRTMSNMVNAMVEWDMEKQQITIVGKTTDAEGKEARNSLVLLIGEAQYYKNGSVFTLDVPPQLKGDTPMIPIGIVADFLNGEATWNNTSRTVTITSTKEAPQAKVKAVPKEQPPTQTPVEPADSQPKPSIAAPEKDAAQEQSAEDDLAAWGYALQDGIYVEDMAGEKGYGFNFRIYEIASPETTAAVDQQLFKLTITDKYNDRIVHTQSFVYGQLPKALGNLVNLDVPSKYFNESEYSYRITVGGEPQ